MNTLTQRATETFDSACTNADVERIRLGKLPSPVKRLAKLSSRLGNEIWMKDDFSISAEYSGSKIRKLEYLLADAQKKEAQSIATFGCLGSNHCVATTVYATALGLRTRLFLSPQILPDNSDAQRNFRWLQASPAKSTTHSFFCRTLIEFGLERRARSGDRQYAIKTGGTSFHGCIGAVRAAIELAQQVDKGELPLPKTLFVTVGSGGMLAGLASGFDLLGWETNVIGVNISKSFFVYRKVKNLRHILRTFFMPKGSPDTLCNVALINDSVGKGYAMPTAAALYAQALLSEVEQVDCDTTYTAKTASILIERSKTEKGPIVFWNTRGTFSERKCSSEYAPSKPCKNDLLE